MSRREAAARLSAAEERQQRIKAALEETTRLQRKQQERRKPDDDGGDPPGSSGGSTREPRASTTDAEARVMRFADGGFRPGYNAQLATTVDSQVIVGVDVSNSGSDFRKLIPMLEQCERRYGGSPSSALVDGGFASLADIVAAAGPDHRCTVYAATMAPRPGRRVTRPRKGDTEAISAWRRRMASARGKAVYRERGATAECVNALARNRGLIRLTVRGLENVRAVLLFYALGHNLLRGLGLRAAAAT